MGKNESQKGPEVVELHDLKTQFDTAVNMALEQQNSEKMLKSALWRKLDVLKDGIKRLREKNIPYKEIARMIQEVTSKGGNELTVSEQTLRSYCQTVLELPKVYRSSKKNNSEV